MPKNGTTKVCSKHVCEDTVDEDNDGKNGYPQDPGCDSPTDDDETDGSRRAREPDPGTP